MKKGIKDEFLTYLEKLDVVTSLQQKGSKKSHGPPYGNTLGIYWHKILSDKLNQKAIEEKADDILAGQLIHKLKEQCNITLLEPDFPLYGYVYNKTDSAQSLFVARCRSRCNRLAPQRREVCHRRLQSCRLCKAVLDDSECVWKVPTPVLDLRKASSAAYET